MCVDGNDRVDRNIAEKDILIKLNGDFSVFSEWFGCYKTDFWEDLSYFDQNSEQFFISTTD